MHITKKKPSLFLSALFNHQIFGVWLRLTTHLFVKSVWLVEHFSPHVKTVRGRVDQVRGSNSPSGFTTLRAADERGRFSRKKKRKLFQRTNFFSSFLFNTPNAQLWKKLWLSCLRRVETDRHGKQIELTPNYCETIKLNTLRWCRSVFRVGLIGDWAVCLLCRFPPKECEMIVVEARGRRAGREADWHYRLLMFIILRF